MAKIEQGILGGFSGRVGRVVGYHRHGIWFVRAYQPHVRDRKSDAQLAQRSRFKAMIQFASPATAVLRVGLRQQAMCQGLTEGNVFLKINKGCFSRETRDSRGPRGAGGIEYSGLRFSQGSLPGLRLIEAAVDERGALRVGWQSLGGGRADRVYIYIYSECMGTGIVAEGVRREGRAEVLLPDGFAADTGLHVWAFAASGQGVVSPTAYIACRPSGAPLERAEGEGVAGGLAASGADEGHGVEVASGEGPRGVWKLGWRDRESDAARGQEAVT